MTEEKKQRTKSEIENDFRNLCARVGFIQFEVSQKENDIQLLNDQLRELNNEGLKAVAAEKEAAAKEASLTTTAAQETPNV